MAQVFDTLLLLALPASGKSEVRRYLDGLPPQVSERDFHMGRTVQLDDFPYVHVMRRVDDELMAMEAQRVFFQAADKSFQDPYDWGTLIQLVNEDYDDLVARRAPKPDAPGMDLLERLERAGQAAGAVSKIAKLDDAVRGKLATALDAEAREMLEEKAKNIPDTLKGKTLVIEFARGGPDGSAMPLDPPMGYQHSLGQLSEPILATSAILYIWVTPEESRRKNDARTDPNDPGSILHHGVPIDVMMNDYGCDDIDHLLATSSKPGTVEVSAQGRTFHLPLARFDNRVDKTTFLRDDQKDWKPADVKAVHEGLKQPCDAAFANYS